MNLILCFVSSPTAREGNFQCWLLYRTTTTTRYILLYTWTHPTMNFGCHFVFVFFKEVYLQKEIRLESCKINLSNFFFLKRINLFNGMKLKWISKFSFNKIINTVKFLKLDSNSKFLIKFKGTYLSLHSNILGLRLFISSCL